jgi:hypothetical protein
VNNTTGKRETKNAMLLLLLKVVTIVDINDFAPTFPEPWSDVNPYITINVVEEQPNGTVVHKFVASDADSNIESYEIQPKNPYFYVEPGL